MKNLTALLLVLCFSVIASAGQAATYWNFVGISQPVSPASGLPALDGQCKSDFGPEARMCFSAEVVATSNWPEQSKYLSEVGFMRPVFTVVSAGADMYHFVDVSGAWTTYQSSPSCDQWSKSESRAGITFSSQGHIRFRSCSWPDTGVACCIPDPSATSSEVIFCTGFEGCPQQ